EPNQPVIYKVQVTTGKGLLTGTFDSISITLVGTNGESPKHLLNRVGTKQEVPCEHDLGPVLLIRLHKDPYSFFPESSWFCDAVRVTSPQGEVFRFPCYTWVEGYCTVSFREGTGELSLPTRLGVPNERDTWRQVGEGWRMGLLTPISLPRWKEYLPGVPWCADIDTPESIEYNIHFSFPKASAFFGRGTADTLQHFIFRFFSISILLQCSTRDYYNAQHGALSFFTSSEYVYKHWKDDEFFGYQYLNGINPVVIRKCTQIPANFPVTQEMVAGSLGESTTLKEELKKGTIFLADYKVLEGVPTTLVNGKEQFIAAPLCLLHQKPTGEITPIAIQLSQHPGHQSPIFLPTDDGWIWILAKTWVRNAEFHTHEVIAHLLRGHLMAEVFTVATLRQLPMCHPLYKLLIPHLRYSIHINVTSGLRLPCTVGFLLLQAIATGRKGLAVILSKALDNLTYTDLCLPDDIESRGVGSLLNYYYRDDGMKIWDAIESFVSGIVELYYKNNLCVQRDYELQAWISDIFTRGFLTRRSSGIPSSLRSVPELIKFLTMVVFTCSAYHAAVNSGQFELGAFMPNLPSSMRKPPPQVKAAVTLGEFLDTIPEMNTTSQVLSVLWVLRNEDLDMKQLGQYDEEHFVEEEPKQLITAFQERLAHISEEIKKRNESLELPYTYLFPPSIENSTAI
uniref:Arachidonate lipoxygenase 3 n=1 Tax=Varanus komodoensis TaxID=61221 RepID=A0A8D2LWV8_VARKO